MALPAIHTKAASEIDISDIEALLGVPEDSRLEFKSGLHYEKGQAHCWEASQTLADASAVEIAREVAAFANASGGVVVLGIQEKSPESVAVAPSAVPFCEKLAVALEQSIRDRIDPPLTQLEVKVVSVPELGGSGYLVLRVPSSGRRPHIVKAKKNFIIPIRKGRAVDNISAREMQDLALRAYFQSENVSNRLLKLKSDAVRDNSHLKIRRANFVSEPTFSIHVAAVPSEPLSLYRVSSSEKYDLVIETVTARTKPEDYGLDCTFRWARNSFSPKFLAGYRRMTAEIFQ